MFSVVAVNLQKGQFKFNRPALRLFGRNICVEHSRTYFCQLSLHYISLYNYNFVESRLIAVVVEFFHIVSHSSTLYSQGLSWLADYIAINMKKKTFAIIGALIAGGLGIAIAAAPHAVEAGVRLLTDMTKKIFAIIGALIGGGLGIALISSTTQAATQHSRRTDLKQSFLSIFLYFHYDR